MLPRIALMLVALQFAASPEVAAQALTPLLAGHGTPDLRTVLIDPSTGAFTAVGTLGPGFLLGTSAFDPVHRVEYAATTSTTLAVLNVDSGEVVATMLSRPVEGLVVDEAHGILYGVAGRDFVSIDGATGTVSTIAAVTAGHAGFTPGTFAFDPFRSVAYYSDGSELIEFNVATHASRVIALNPLPELLIFDRVAMQLFAIVFTPRLEVERIDPATGSTTIVATLPGSSTFNQVRAFDPVSRRFYVAQRLHKLIVANVDSGAVMTLTLPDDLTFLDVLVAPASVMAVPISRGVLALLALAFAVIALSHPR